MFRHLWRPAVAAGVTALALTLVHPASVRVDARATLQVIASGLFNPRGLNFGPDGALYVAEAGSGGTGPCIVGSDGLTKCYGATGAVTKIVLNSPSAATRVVTGLPSIAPAGGAFATGAHDVDFQGLGNGYVTIGFGADPAKRLDPAFASVGDKFGRLVRFKPNGKWSFEEDLAGFEDLANPDKVEPPDSNPYGVLALPGRQVYTDAGGNSLNAVAANGSISNLAVFPRGAAPFPPYQAVPTSVALGPDGDFYVGQLTGGPFPAGAASVYKVPSGGGTPAVFATGFNKIIDVAFGPDGLLYVLEIKADPGGPPAAPGAPGALIRVNADGSKTMIVAPGEGLFTPGGMAFGSDGSIYVTNRSIDAGGAGTVVKIVP